MLSEVSSDACIGEGSQILIRFGAASTYSYFCFEHSVSIYVCFLPQIEINTVIIIQF